MAGPAGWFNDSMTDIADDAAEVEDAVDAAEELKSLSTLVVR